MYFTSIVTTANQPNFTSAAQRHALALDNYIKYGRAIENPVVLTLPLLPKQIEVEKITTTIAVLNGTIYTTSILCCDDDKEDKDDE